jgi:hypothetical protein
MNRDRVMRRARVFPAGFVAVAISDSSLTQTADTQCARARGTSFSFSEKWKIKRDGRHRPPAGDRSRAASMTTGPSSRVLGDRVTRRRRTLHEVAGSRGWLRDLETSPEIAHESA